LGVDRILDMARTATNVTGDSAVAVLINDAEERAEARAEAA
jgi:Na+/H+-dicarboxylate symporter